MTGLTKSITHVQLSVLSYHCPDLAMYTDLFSGSANLALLSKTFLCKKVCKWSVSGLLPSSVPLLELMQIIDMSL